VTYRLRGGGSICVPGTETDINPFTDIWLRHVYDSPLIDLRSARTVIDVGAHVGAFSLYALRHAPQARVIALEPAPMMYSFLQRNIADNGAEGKILPRQRAMNGTGADVTLHVSRGHGEATSAFRSVGETEDVVVRSTRLQDVFDAEGIDVCDVLKLNAEGVEYEILYGLPEPYLRRIRSMVLNYHTFVQDPVATGEALRAYLEQHGFEVREQGKRILVARRPSPPAPLPSRRERGSKKRPTATQNVHERPWSEDVPHGLEVRKNGIPRACARNLAIIRRRSSLLPFHGRRAGDEGHDINAF
jgi:FkbM family methyltransferase